MAGEEDKELDQVQDHEQESVEKSVSRVAYAISRIKKHQSETFDLMAEKAVEFYLSKENKGLPEAIINAMLTLVYFIAFAIAHPVLTNKLRKSVEAQWKSEDPEGLKKFAIEVMKDENVWEQIVNNKNLRPHLIKLGESLITGAGLPFPSYKQMEAEYIKLEKAKGATDPKYIPSSYLRSLMKVEIEGFEDEPKRGTPEFKAKWDYINGIIQHRKELAEQLYDGKTLDAVLATVQNLMTDEAVNKAIVGYIEAPESVPLATTMMLATKVLKDENMWEYVLNNKVLRPQLVKLGESLVTESGLPFPSYSEMKAEYIKLEQEKGVAKPKYMQSLYLESLMKVKIEGFEDEPKSDTPEYKAKWDYINGILEQRKELAELLHDEKILDGALATVQTIMTNEGINKAIEEYVVAPEDAPVAAKTMPLIGWVCEALASVDEERAAKMVPFFDDLPRIVKKIPAVEDAVPDFVNIGEALSMLFVGTYKDGKIWREKRLATFGLINNLAVLPGLSAVLDASQVDPERLNAEVIKLIRSGELGQIWIALTAHPTFIPYVSQVIEAYFDRNANLTFKERKELHDLVYKAPEYTKELDESLLGNARKHLIDLAEAEEYYPDQMRLEENFLSKTFEERKAVYDNIHKDDEPPPDYTEKMYEKEQEEAKASALSMKKYMVALRDFAESPELIDQALLALENIMADGEVAFAVLQGLQDPEKHVVNQAKWLVREMEFPSYVVMEDKYWERYNIAKNKLAKEDGIKISYAGFYNYDTYLEELEDMYLPHYLQWAQAREAAYEAQGLSSIEFTKRMYIDEVLEMKSEFMLTLDDSQYNIAAARHILTNNSIAGLNYAPKVAVPKNELLPTFALSLIRTVLDKGLSALDPLLAQLPTIASKMPALPGFIKLDELTAALLGDGSREDTFTLIADLFSQYEYFEKIYASEDMAAAIFDYIKSGKLDRLLVSITTHPTLMAYPTLWERVISVTDIRPYIISIVETYLNKVASLSYDERKIVFDRAHKDDKPTVPEYTAEMYEKDQEAAVTSAKTYVALLQDNAVIGVVLELAKFVLMNRNADIQNFLGAPKTTEMVPSTLIPLITSLLEDGKLDPLIGKLESIFRILAPNNFAPDAPEFGEGFIDKSLLNLIFEIFDPSKKAVTYEFLKVALGEINNILKEFSTKSLFEASDAVVGILSKNPILKGFVEANSAVIAKVVRYVALKMFGKQCKQYGVEDKFWGVLDILFKDLGAASGILKGLVEITKGENFATGQGIEKAVDALVRELVKLLNHEKIGPELKQFIRDNKPAFVSLINGILDNIPTAKPYITQYVLGLGLTFSDILDQLVHNPNDLIKLLDTAEDLGVLRGVSNPVGLGIGAGIAVAKKAINREGLGVYSPVVQQVIAEAARPYVPQVVVDWTPQWFKNYVPGANAKGDRRGEDFGDWVLNNINRRPPGERINLHDQLVKRSKEDVSRTDEAREFINYNALAKLDFGDEALFLVKYKIDGFSFSGSKAAEIYITDTEMSNTNFSHVKAKECIIKNSELRKVDFTGLGFVKESVGWFYSSMVANPDAVLVIRDSKIDEASLKSLEEAAKKAPFTLELINVEVIKEPVKEVPVTVPDTIPVPDGEKLLEEYSKECAQTIIAHLKTVKFIDEGLALVEDKELREFLESVMEHAFNHMPQENLMYLPKINTEKLYSVLRSKQIVRSLESVYGVDDDDKVYVDKKSAIQFKDEVLQVISDFCTRERLGITEKPAIKQKADIEPRSDIEPQGKINPGEGLGREIGK